MSALAARDLVKEYGGERRVRALDGVSLDVADGEFVVVVGPSGCGKSTLLRLFAGLVDPTAGAVLYGGEPVAGPGRERAMVFQGFNLFPWRTALENVTFGLEMAGVGRAERRERARETLALVGLDADADRYPGALSGGMRQRVGLARALAADPGALLMDEPFGALDARTRATLQRELLEIRARDRTTVLFVTHDVDEALLLGDRVVVMRDDPNRVAARLDVPFDRPRSGRDLETTAAFVDLKRRVRAVLRDGEARG
jgi:NitT/TauT family transport system ATP-binding protein